MAQGLTHDDSVAARSALRRQYGARPPRTVIDMVLNVAHRHDRGPTFLDEKLAPRAWTFAGIVEQARRCAAFLRERGVLPGERVALIAVDAQDFMPAFYGTVLAGAIPVPMPLPVSTRAMATYVEASRRILATAGCSTALVPRMVSSLAGAAFDALPGLRQVLLLEDVPREGDLPFEPFEAQPSDTCFMQFTSGSTSAPKGVLVSHDNLIANAHGIMHGWLRAGPEDVGASWLPLFHDMGLIGFMIAPLLTATPVVFIPTLAFVQRPSIWMQVVHQHHATISVSPNFGFALAVKRARDVETLDLRRLRVIGCGAEPINPATLAAFSACYAQAGLAANVISPLYGLAEATLLASCRPAGEPLRVVELDKQNYEQGRARLARVAGAARVQIVGCGRALSGHEIQIHSAEGTVLPEGRIGEVVVFGPSVTPGYFGHEPSHARGLHTGDLGFLLDGELFVSGRKKDMMVVNGRNLYPQAIEWELEQIPGLRRGSVVVFSVPYKDNEGLVVLAEAAADVDERLEASIRTRMAEAFNLPARAARVLPQGSIPKTSSGKLQRAQARELWLRGVFEPASAAPSA